MTLVDNEKLSLTLQILLEICSVVNFKFALLIAFSSSLAFGQVEYQRHLVEKNWTLLSDKGLQLERSVFLEWTESIPQTPVSFDGEVKLIITKSLNPKALFVPGAPFEIYLHHDLYQRLKHTHFRVLLHEYFHLLHYLVNPQEELWMREGAAQYFEYLQLGEFHAAHLQSMSQLPHADFLTLAEGQQFLTPPQYGKSLMFIHYLLRRCSKIQFWDLVKREKSVSDLLLAHQCGTFDDLYLDFTLASVHNLKQHLKGDTEKERYYLSPSLKSPLFNSLQPPGDPTLSRYFQPYMVTLETPENADVKWYRRSDEFPYHLEEVSMQKVDEANFMLIRLKR